GGVRRDVLEEFAERGGGAVGRGVQGADGGGAGRLGERVLHRVGEQLVDVAVVGVDRGAVDTGRAGDRGDAEGAGGGAGGQGERGLAEPGSGALSAGVVRVHGGDSTAREALKNTCCLNDRCWLVLPACESRSGRTWSAPGPTSASGGWRPPRRCSATRSKSSGAPTGSILRLRPSPSRWRRCCASPSPTGRWKPARPASATRTTGCGSPR